MLKVTVKGKCKKSRDFLKKIQNGSYEDKLEYYGELGVEALAKYTPKDTGLTASSWGYKIERGKDSATIIWTNSNIQGGYANIALLLQYGHATRNHGYVRGRDYINPAMKPVFDKIEEDAWDEVTKG